MVDVSHCISGEETCHSTSGIKISQHSPVSYCSQTRLSSGFKRGSNDSSLNVAIEMYMFMKGNSTFRQTCLYVLSATHIIKKNIQVRQRRSRKLITAKTMTGVMVGAPQKIFRSSFTEMDCSCSRFFVWKSRWRKGRHANPMVTTFPSI